MLDAQTLPLNMIGIKKVAGGALEETTLVPGVAFKKTFSYAGFEMQPKSYKNCKIALLNIELELKAEKDNAEVRLDNVEEYQKVVDAEWNILYDKLEKIANSGAMKNDSIVAGGGAIDMELSKYLRNHSRTVAGKEQLIIGAMAKAFEVIARQLCDNAGFDATNILNKLRQKHAGDGTWYGVDVLNEDIADNFEACVWEPAIVKSNAITAASEAACLLLSVDETVKNPRSGQGADQMGGGMPPMGRGRGRPM